MICAGCQDEILPSYQGVIYLTAGKKAWHEECYPSPPMEGSEYIRHAGDEFC